MIDTIDVTIPVDPEAVAALVAYDAGQRDRPTDGLSRARLTCTGTP